MFEILYDTKKGSFYPLLIKKCSTKFNTEGRGFLFFHWGKALIEELENLYLTKQLNNKEVVFDDIWKIVNCNTVYLPKYKIQNVDPEKEKRFQDLLKAAETVNKLIQIDNFWSKYKPNIEGLIVYRIDYEFVQFIKQQFNVPTIAPHLDLKKGESKIEILKFNKNGLIFPKQEIQLKLENQLKLTMQ